MRRNYIFEDEPFFLVEVDHYFLSIIDLFELVSSHHHHSWRCQIDVRDGYVKQEGRLDSDGDDDGWMLKVYWELGQSAKISAILLIPL